MRNESSARLLAPALSLAVRVTFALSLAGCGITHLARPVGAGHTRIEASVGGPIFTLLKAPIPVPMGVVSVAHGLRDDLDVHVDGHATAAAFGVVGATVGSAFHFGDPSRRVFTVGGDVSGFTKDGEWLTILDPWIAMAWRLGRHFWVIPGIHATYAGGGERRQFVPAVFVQGAWQPTKRTAIEAEVRWMAPFSRTNDLAPAWASIGDQGAVVVLLGVAWDAGGGGR